MDRPNPPLAPAPDKGSEEHCQNHPSSERREWHVGTDKQIGQRYASLYPGWRPFRRSPDSIASPAKNNVQSSSTSTATVKLPERNIPELGIGMYSVNRIHYVSCGDPINQPLRFMCTSAYK